MEVNVKIERRNYVWIDECVCVGAGGEKLQKKKERERDSVKIIASGSSNVQLVVLDSVLGALKHQSCNIFNLAYSRLHSKPSV